MPQNYEIYVQELIDEDWTHWLDNFTITHQPNGTTRLVGTVPDQAALHGLFIRLRDLGTTILKVQRIGSERIA